MHPRRMGHSSREREGGCTEGRLVGGLCQHGKARPRGLLGWNLWWLACVLHWWLVVHLANLAGNLLGCALLRRNVLRRAVQLPGGFHGRRGCTVAAWAWRALGSALVSGGLRRATPHRTAKAVKDRVAVAV